VNNGGGFLKELLLEMNISDWIQVLSIISTLLISVVSITIATKSLKLTKKSIEDANKPFISCYIEMVEVGHFQKYFVIQNYGKTPATILDVRFNKEITGLGRNGSIESIKNSLIAPNQKFITAVKVDEKSRFQMTIIYNDMNNQVYENTFDLNLGFSSDLLHIESNNSGLTKDTNALRNALHQFTKRTL